MHEQLGNYSYFLGSVLYTAGAAIYLFSNDYETYGASLYFAGSVLFVLGSISNIIHDVA
jgi:hypothetical protein